MQHLDDGALRRSLDEPWSVSARSRDHVRDCAVCSTRRDAISRDAGFAGDKLGIDDGPRGPVDASYARLQERIGRDGLNAGRPSLPERIADYYRFGGRPVVMSAAAIAATAAAVLALAFTPVGTYAQSFLTIFEPHQFVAVPVTKADIQYLPDLQSFGTIVEHVQPRDRKVLSAAQASSLTGLPVRMPAWLPAGVPRAVHYIAISRGSASFIFSAAKARAFAAGAHKPMPAMPPGLDGSTLTLQVGPMVIVGYGDIPSSNSGSQRGSEDDGADFTLPALIIVQSAAPVVSSTGASAREIESYLLDMPGVSPRLADEIRAIGDPSTTMPIPIPVDKAFAQNVAIDGVTGLGIGDNTGVGGMLMWQKSGMVFGVGGALAQRDLMGVARSLR